MTDQENTKNTLSPIEVAHAAANHMLSRKATDVVILDLRSINSAADFFVIGSAGSDQQVRAVSDAVVEGLEDSGVKVYHVEGYQDRRWVLLDAFDVVVHIFHDELRGFYGLERLWGDAPIEKVED